jgi:hypothetical protein
MTAIGKAVVVHPVVILGLRVSRTARLYGFPYHFVDFYPAVHVNGNVHLCLAGGIADLFKRTCPLLIKIRSLHGATSGF